MAWHGSTIEGIDAIATEADRLGFRYFWVPEAWGLEAFSVASRVLSKTSSIHVGIGIANVFSRSAALIGMGCATLDQMAPGRFVLGLGSSGKLLVENWHGVEFSKPLKRTQEYVETIRKVALGQQIESRRDGSLSKFRLFTKPMQQHLEIYLGAISDNNLRLGGEICDGAILAMYPSSRLEHALEVLGGGRSKKLFTYLPTAVSKSEEELLGMKKDIANNVLFYVRSMGEYYARNLARLGFENEVRRIRETKNVDQSSIEVVGEKLLSDLSLIGSPKAIAERISEFPEGVTLVFGFGSKSKEDVKMAINSMNLLSSGIS